MKSKLEVNSEHSNNWLRMHGCAMGRFGGKRKRMSAADYHRLPFPIEKYSNKGRRFLKRIAKN